MVCLLLQVCSVACQASDPLCKPLTSFQLRLDDKILDDPRYFKAVPSSSLVKACSPRGPGLLFNSSQLGKLATADPSKVGLGMATPVLWQRLLRMSSGVMNLPGVKTMRYA